MQSGPPLFWYLQHFVNLLMPYAVAAVGITLISVTPLGQAAISWLKGHINRGRAAELGAALEQVRFELADVQERLDFAERQLASAASAGSPQFPRPREAPEGQGRIPTPA